MLPPVRAATLVNTSIQHECGRVWRGATVAPPPPSLRFPPPPVDAGDGDAKDGSIGDGVEDTGDGVGGGCGVPVLPLEGAGALHTVSVVVVQAVLTPAVHVEAQAVHGVLPEVEKVLPASHGTLHAVSVVVVQAVLTPAVHVEAQAVHGVLPEVEKFVPATHGTLHAVSVVVVQAVLTPRVHVEAAVQVVHGALPEAEKVL